MCSVILCITMISGPLFHIHHPTTSHPNSPNNYHLLLNLKFALNAIERDIAENTAAVSKLIFSFNMSRHHVLDYLILLL